MQHQPTPTEDEFTPRERASPREIPRRRAGASMKPRPLVEAA
jgi:hypothetical protein